MPEHTTTGPHRPRPWNHQCAAVALACVMAAAIIAAQSVAPAAGQGAAAAPPTFRAAANYVRVDLYATAGGAAIDDLRPDEIELREDGVVQTIDAFEHVRVRGATDPAPHVEPNTVADSSRMIAATRARVIVIYLDTYNTQSAGSAIVGPPLARLLDRVLGPDDLVAVMTPQTSPRSLTFGRKTTVIDGMLERNRDWGTRGEFEIDRTEQLYNTCYPSFDRQGQPDNTAAEMRQRRREQLTFDSIADLLPVLGSLREERKAVLMVSEGWLEFRPNPRLADPQRDERGAPIIPPPQVFGLDPRPNGDGGAISSSMRAQCEGDRMTLAQMNHRNRVRELAEIANRANVTFYGIYPRGPAALDAPVGIDRPPDVLTDVRNLTTRQQSLRQLSDETDGVAVVNTLQFEPAIERIFADLSSYYLLGYYSTNAKLDGRFREIRVRLTRPGVQVRARRGYRALTTEAARLTGTATSRPPDTTGAGRRLTGVGVDDKASFRVRAGSLVDRAGQTTTRVWVVGELDPRTRRELEWTNGGTATVALVVPDGTTLAMQSVSVPTGTSSFVARLDVPRELPANVSVQVRVQSAMDGVAPLTASVPALANADALGDAMLFRRGPSTGNRVVATADPRFTRTERLILEWPSTEPAAGAAQLLDRAGHPLALPVQVTTRPEPGAGWSWIVAEVVLAPLAPGDYGVEVSHAGTTRVTEFRVVP